MYKGFETHEAIPEAASMIETFRAIGYNLETAIADIIDNSITACANKITIQRYWKGGASVITIKDNGKGMTNEELIDAMRPGSQNPLADRDPKDLGRFGLGLKTASFSQCRKLTVISKKNNQMSYWTWDLDFVAQTQKWNIIHWCPEEYKNALDDVDTGTFVIWSALDRILPADTDERDEISKEKFSASLQKVRDHIAMTFHRFIEEKQIAIIWGSHEIAPWNPFCPNEKKRQTFPVDHLPGNVTVTGYVLPHKHNFTNESAFHTAEGPKGWSGQQGFYVYRGKRLLLSGEWLGMFRKEESSKLARIAIDLPNNLDAEWQIDIKKSKARPPVYCKDQLEAYAKMVRKSAEEVFRHRGKILKQRAGREFHPLWLDKKKDSNWSYVINRDNPLIIYLKEHAAQNPKEAIDQLLLFIESNVPTKTIFINEAKDEGQNDTNKLIDITEYQQTIKGLYTAFINQGNTPDQAKAQLKLIEPFNMYEDFIDSVS